MANYGYSTPFQGFQQGLPAGYMQAATDPGRNIGDGIASFGNDIGKAIERYKVRREESAYADQRIGDLLQMALGESQKGDPHSNELLNSVMSITKQKDPEGLLKFASDVPGMTLAKKKALVHDLEFNIQRTDQNRQRDAQIKAIEADIRHRDQLTNQLSLEAPYIAPLKDAQLAESDAATQYRQQVLEQVKREEALKSNTIKAYNEISNIPLDYSSPQDVNRSVNVMDENGNVLASGPESTINVTGRKRFSDYFKEASAIFNKYGVPVDPEKVSSTFQSMGGQMDIPDGMTPTGMSIKTPNGVVQLENMPAKLQEAILKHQAEISKAKEIFDYQQLPEIEKRKVFLPDGKVALAGSEKSAEKVKDMVSGYNAAIPAIGQLIEIFKQPAHSFNPKTRKDVISIIGVLKGQLRVPITGPGTMSNQDQERLDEMINNPNKIFTWDDNQISGLNSLKKALQGSLDAQLKAEGIKPYEGSETKRKVYDPVTNSWE